MKWILSFAFIVLLIISPDKVAISSKNALDTCVNILFPSLFPFFVCADIFIKSGGGRIFGYILNPIMKPFFNISKNGAGAFVLGIISGYPVGAKTAVDLYKENAITKDEAQSLVCFCNNSGPLFIIGALGEGMLHSKEIGLFLYAIHILSSVTMGVILRFTIPKTNSTEYFSGNHIRNNIFTSAVENSMTSVIKIFAYVIFFAVIMDIFDNIKLFTVLEKWLEYLKIPSSLSDPLIRSAIEMTSGLKKLSASYNTLSIKLIFSSFILGWSGISVLFQTKSIIDEAGLDFKKYTFFKFIHGVIAATYTFYGVKIFDFSNSASSIIGNSTHNLQIPECLFALTYYIGMAYIILQVHLKYRRPGSRQMQTKATRYKL